MISLYKYILENVDLVVEAFDQGADDFKSMIKAHPGLNAKDYKREVNLLLNRLKTYIDGKCKNMFTFDRSLKHFNINRIYTGALSDMFSKKCNEEEKQTSSDRVEYRLKDEIIMRSKSLKRFRLVKTSNSMNVYIDKKFIFKIGNGSVNRIKTADQENGTCIVWNRYINILNNIDAKESVKMDVKFVESILKGFPYDWMDSFSTQIATIYNFLKNEGETPEEYMMVRYGGNMKDLNKLVRDNKIDDEATAKTLEMVGKAYADAIKAYVNNFPDSQKDNFDPSDVILYKVSDVNNTIIQKLEYITKAFASTDEERVKKAKQSFIDELFKTHSMFGISLKKVSSYRAPQCDLFNINYDETSSNIEVTGNTGVQESGTGLKIICSGNFKFSGVTSADSNEKESGENTGGVKESKISINMRTFGGSIGIDCCVVNGSHTEPALGKCPVTHWRKELGVTKNSDLDTCKKALIKKMGSFKKQDQQNKFLENIIRYAAKEGPACFPFILIH